MTQSSSSAPRSASESAGAQPAAGGAPAGAAEWGRPADGSGAASLSGVEVSDGAVPSRASRPSLLRRLGGVLKRGSSSGASWSSVGTTAVAKVVVMGVSGVFGLVNSSLIIRHFGADAFAQYGLLATFPTLMPFTDLGIGAVVVIGAAVAAPLVPVVVGEDYRPVAGLLWAFAALGVTLSVLQAFLLATIASDRTVEAGIAWCGLALTAVAVWLAPREVDGVLAAALVAVVLTTVTAGWRALRSRPA